MTDSEHVSPVAVPQQARGGEVVDEKYPSMRPLSDQISGSDSESDSAQAGVKRLEAISTTWTKKSLIMAYIG